MNDERMGQMELELAELAESVEGTTKIGLLIDMTYKLKTLCDKANDIRKSLDKRIKQALIDNDMKTASGLTRKVSLANRSFFGIRAGETDEEYNANATLAFAFVEKYGPKAIKATTASIKKALEVFQQEHPGEVPAFIEEHSDPVLRNLKQ